MAIEVGSILEGVVTGITNFGAFVELPGGVTGLVHISEVADTYVKDVNEFLKDKDKVKVKVIAIDPKGKIGLSIKQANEGYAPPAPRPKPTPMRRQQQQQQPSFTLEDRISKFLKDSDERLTDLKRNTESKRGGRGGRRDW
jgi:S1 RNA binding domain protein